MRARGSASPRGVLIGVEDDGAGIAPEQRAAVLARGGRLDQRGEGAGPGLAIVQDVLEAYGWTLLLETSELGGLRVSCRARAGNRIG